MQSFYINRVAGARANEYLKLKTAQERIHLKFWHPQGRHDDQPFALTLACYATKEKQPEGTLARAW